MAGMAGAEGLQSRVSIWGAGGYASPGKFNDAMNELSTAFFSEKMGAITSIYGLGFEGDIATSENVLLGLRLGYLQTPKGTAELTVPGTGTGRLEAYGVCIPIKAGFRYMIPIDDNLWAGFGAFAGVAQVEAHGKVSIDVGAGPLSSSFIYGANPVVVDGLLCFDYRLFPGISLGADLGYSRIRANSLAAASDLDIDMDGNNEVREGDPFKNAAGEKVAFDLSGAEFALSLNLSF